MYIKSEKDKETGEYVTSYSREPEGIVNLNNLIEKTIDVDNYNGPVTILPTEGNDGMAAAIVTLLNYSKTKTWYVYYSEFANSDSETDPYHYFVIINKPLSTDGDDDVIGVVFNPNEFQSDGGSYGSYSFSSYYFQQAEGGCDHDRYVFSSGPDVRSDDLHYCKITL